MRSPRRALCTDGLFRGWSLTELLMVLAVIGILVALAMPNYQQHQRQTRRGDARAALMQLQIDQALHRARHDTFAVQVSDLGWSGERSPQGHYRIEITLADTDTYEAQALPLGTQSVDSDCNPLRIAWRDSATVLYSSGANAESDPAKCWQR